VCSSFLSPWFFTILGAIPHLKSLPKSVQFLPSSSFRLICATNRDLWDLIRRGEFRADLYYRIAGFVTKLPPLRDRHEDIIPLAEHFLRQAHPDGQPPELDDAVRYYLLRREYPGNVRDLEQAVSRLTYRHPGDRTISVGCVPPEERPVLDPDKKAWLDLHFERPIKRAVLLGAGLKEIGRAAEEAAIRCVTDEEDGNLQRAARRAALGSPIGRYSCGAPMDAISIERLEDGCRSRE
jgi:transcriptional regulator with GAF, ATPase, and Fis domain